MKNKIFILLFFACYSCLHAATYYVSKSALGHDENNGTSMSSPWRTNTKVNTLSLQPGDSILFERGHIYRGQINVTHSGVPGNPIYYGAYGTGDDPVISGALTVANTGWTVYDGHIFVKNNVNMTAMSAVQAPNLFFNGQLLIPARFPNGENYLIANEVYGIPYNPPYTYEHSWALKDDSLNELFSNSSDLLGGFVTAFNPYGIRSRRINAYDPYSGTVSFDKLSGTSPGSPFMSRKTYFLSRALSLLDTPGEWFYDDAKKELYVWFPDNAPPESGADRIEYSYYHYGIRFSAFCGYLKVEHLEFRNQQIAGILMSRNNEIKIENNKFYDCKNGIWGIGGLDDYPGTLRNIAINDNEFLNIHRIGVFINNFNMSNPRVDSVTIKKNVFRNIGRHNALMQTTNNQWGDCGRNSFGIGILLLGTNSLITLNRMDSLGRPGIEAGGTGTLIKNNVINYPCMSYNDCGGIMPLGNSVVDANIVKNSYGYYSRDWSYGGRGIYPDFRSGDVIKNNTIINTVTGIGLTHGINATIKNNTVYNSSRSSFHMSRKITVPLNNTIKNNVFFSIPSHEERPLHGHRILRDNWIFHKQSIVHWENHVSGIDHSNVFDGNYYWNSYSYYPAVKYKRETTSGVYYQPWWDMTWYDLEQWQATGQDPNSKKEFLFVNEPYIITDTIGNNLVQNGDFSSGTTVAWGKSTEHMTFEVVTGQLDGPCAHIYYQWFPWTGSAYQKINEPFIKDNYYLIGFTVKGTASINENTSSDGKPLLLELVETGNNDNKHYYRGFKNSVERQDLWSVFKAHENVDLTIRFIAPAGRYYLDNVSIFPVKVSYDNPKTKFPIFINETSLPAEVNLHPDTIYHDLDGNRVQGIMTLQPFSSEIMIAGDSSIFTNTFDKTPRRKTPSFNIFPNPASDNITIIQHSSAENYESIILIIDIRGVLLMRKSLWRRRSEFDISSLTKGVYLMKYIGCNETETIKFIKK